MKKATYETFNLKNQLILDLYIRSSWQLLDKIQPNLGSNTGNEVVHLLFYFFDMMMSDFWGVNNCFWFNCRLLGTRGR